MMTFPVLKRTLAIFRSPELGFLGFVVPTFRHTPFSSGRLASCGDRSFRALCCILPWRRTWINVHLLARGAGVGPKESPAKALCSGVAASGDRAAVRGDCAKTEGRTRRRRNWTGMAAAVMSLNGRGRQKFELRRDRTEGVGPCVERSSGPVVSNQISTRLKIDVSSNKISTRSAREMSSGREIYYHLVCR